RARAVSARCREIVSLSLETDPEIRRPVRRGLELMARINGVDVSLLNDHLKSGCSRGPLDSRTNDACIFLQHQTARLESWIEDRANAGRAFLILGDWNRDLEQEIRGRFPPRSDGSDPTAAVVPDKVRNLYPEINDGVPRA